MAYPSIPGLTCARSATLSGKDRFKINLNESQSETATLKRSKSPQKPIEAA